MGRPSLRIRLLGTFQVELGASPVSGFESNKVRALLAFLALESNQAHSREKLAAIFWPDLPADKAAPNLSRALYNLRGVIQDHQANPPYVLRSRNTIRFNPNSRYWLDVAAFQSHLGQAESMEPAQTNEIGRRMSNLEAAVQLYRGDLLEGMHFRGSAVFDEWILVHRQHLRQQVEGALHSLTEAYGERGELERALSNAYRQVAMDPLREQSVRQLMRLLAESGQRNQALLQYQRLQVILAEELQIRPEPETQGLWEEIREDALAASEARARDNLPAFLSPMIGRRSELAEVLARLKDSSTRLLTILGPGGSGKTRLALAVARASLEAYKGGVYFVALNPVQSPDSILPAITDALDLPRGDQDDTLEQLASYLRGKEILLVLDGFEHLLDGVKTLVHLLQSAEKLQLLVTSRTRLNSHAEQVYLLSGMQYPGQGSSETEILGSDAVQLLLHGLQRDGNHAEPGPEDLDHLLKICQRVQGMPLGILLAGSWASTFSLAEIAERVTRSLDFLSVDWADLPARQQSLRATFDHTWKLLGEREKGIFQGLSVFRGAFSRQAARVVSGASHHELRFLVDRSLLWNPNPGWYEVHELLRQYGREKLAQSALEEAKACGRHSEYYLNHLFQLREELKGAGQAAALSSIDLEHENYHTAWKWCAEQGETKGLVEALDPMCLYYDLSIRFPDGENACRIALEGLSHSPTGVAKQVLQIRLCAWQSRFTRLLGSSVAASHLIKDALAHLEAAKTAGAQIREVDAFIHLEQGNILFHKDREGATRCYQRSLQIYRSLEDHWGQAKALAGLGLIAHHAGSFKDAFQRYSEALDLYRSVGDPRGIANALVELGHNTLRQGQVSSGQKYIREGTEVLQQIGDRAGFARGCFDLGRSHFWTGQFAQGNMLMAQANPIFEDLGMRDRLVFSIIGAGLGLTHLGRYDDAISQANKGLPMARDLSAFREIAMGHLILGKAHLGQGDLQETQTWALEAIAGYQEIDQRADMAWATALMAFVNRALGDSPLARSYLRQTLEIGIQTRGYFPVLCGLYGVALLFLDRGEIERAIELAALVLQFPVAANSHWFEDVAGREISVASESLPADVVAAARERGRKLDIWETASTMLEDFSIALN